MTEVVELLNRLNILSKIVQKTKEGKGLDKIQEEYFQVVAELDKKRLQEYLNKQNNGIQSK
jgi:hypothetical protein